MATYNYKAKTAAGTTVTGSFEAADKNMVVELIKEKGYYPLSIEAKNEKGVEINFKFNKKIKPKEFAVLCRQFHTMLNAGVTVIGCLDMLRQQTENKTLKEAISSVYDEVQKGSTLSEAMKALPKVFPPLMVSMVEVGEVGGTLEAVLERLAIQYEKDSKIKSKVSTAMVYPAVIGCIALVMVTFMLIFIVPTFVGIINSTGGELPTPTKILLYISGLFTNPIFIVGLITAIILLRVGFKKFKSTEGGKYIIDKIIYKMPLVGPNVKKILAASFTRTMSTLLSSGVSLIQSLEVVDRVVNNQVVSRGLIQVSDDIKSGSNLAAPLERMGIFPLMVTQMISVGEEAGSLDAIMEKVADFYDEEVETSISKLLAMLEPLMMMVLAVIVGFMVIAMIMPTFTMNQGIGQ
ncbi:type II secretion system F family protein [Ruminiclostridium herbifermentans]|uniref:Type II secretion system F family protein n=1 Tax=Ruminiclostridium herbifermentans TaxID=2488810 RepID=A0A4U7JAL5_9FIRM|nr:type II secretion system F family protein [Ruminiclostridium herbifermentans]QNU68111.1 type II secretion system F family protein [Ruminiclostridium herbifermentans]